MKVRGEAEIWLVDKEGNRTLFGIEENDICWPVWRAMFLNSGYAALAIATKRDALSASNSPGSAHWSVYFGATDIHSTPLNAWYPHDGSVYVDDNTPTWTAGAAALDDDVVTFTATIPAPVGSARTIRVFGLTFNVSGNDTAFTVAENGKFTILRLATPCTQATDTTLAITYRLFFPKPIAAGTTDTSLVAYTDMRKIMKAACDAVNSIYLNYGHHLYNLCSSAYDFGSVNGMLGYESLECTNTGSKHELTDNTVVDYNPTANVYSNAVSIVKSFASNSTPLNGCFLKTLMVGGVGAINALFPGYNYVSRIGVYSPAIPGLSSPLQNIYAQRNAPPGPFQDLTVNNTATMSGTIGLDYSTWTDPKYQKLMRVRITGTGDNTTATYQVDVMKFIAGFAGNRWLPRTAILPQNGKDDINFRTNGTHAVYESDIVLGGTIYRTPDDERYVVAASGHRTTAGISVYDIYTGSKYNFNAISTPALPVTAVADVECTKGYIYVACANTGLWRINPALDTVEAVPAPAGMTNNVYQLCIKNDAAGTLWALYNGGLCKLSNPDAALGSLSWTVHNPTTGSPTFTFAGITDNNWSAVGMMVVDPDDLVADRFLFVTSVAPGISSSNGWRLGFVWWDTSTGTAVNPTTSGVGWNSFVWNLTNLLRMNDSIRCVAGRWVASDNHSVGNTSSDIVHFAYGSNSLDAIRFTTGSYRFARPVPVTINAHKGIVDSTTVINSVYPATFIRAAVLPTIPNGTTVGIASAYKDFTLREGSTSYDATIESNPSIGRGMLGRVLLYLSKSNMFFTYERVNPTSLDTSPYGVTPFMLPPTHAAYAMYKDAFWKTYGWDGSAWVLNHAGSRTAHSTAETLPDMDGMKISFTNGGSGTSFVANEWFITTVGMGLMKDNGTTYNFTLSYDLAPTTTETISGNVPQTPLGALTDEPVTFTPLLPDYTSSTRALQRMIQNKGLLISGSTATGDNNIAIGDQLIPASTDFDLRFKWISYQGSSTTKALGVATGTGTYTYGVHFRYNATTSQLEVYNNTTSLGTIASFDPTKECRITRVGSTITAYYDGVQIGATVTSTAQFVIMARSSGSANESGWYDMKLTYTEGRRVLRVGNQGLGTGSYAANFSSLTSNTQTGDTRVFIGSGSPLQAILDYTTAGVALTGTGRVKVAAGAGWLIFHDSEAANPVSGFTKAHYVLSNAA